MAAGSVCPMPWAIAYTNTADIRCRIFRAVSPPLRGSICRMTANASGGVMALMCSVPIAGKTSRSRLTRMSAACRSAHFGRLRACQSRARASKVSLACRAVPSWAFNRFAALGSCPERSAALASSRAIRASARDTSG
jgi:hypothetical protein